MMHENRLFEALLDVIPFRAYAVDIETYEVVYANKLMRENLYAPQETHCWKKVFGQEEMCSWCSVMALETRGKKTASEKYTCEFFDESDDKWLKSYDELISWPDGRDVKYSILVDISDQKEIQGNIVKAHATLAMNNKQISVTNKNLQITKLKLQKTVRELESHKNEYINNTTSLKQPLKKSLSQIEILKKTILDPNQTKLLEELEENIKNITEILNTVN